MSVASQVIASGPGWYVNDVVCRHGPQDRPFEEQHSTMSIATVTQGTFQYRTRQGAAVLVPGAVLLGNAGACFECGHEHGHGDRCLSFRLEPAFVERAIADAGARRTAFVVPGLPPLPRLMPLLAAAEAARDTRDAEALEELTLRLIGAVASLLAENRPPARRPSVRDERRISAAVRRIEAHAEEPLSLAALADEARLSAYHFLRVFAQVTGMTPHQYVLRARLHRAAVRLRSSDATISAIAFDAGFGDLSTFNRRFRRLFGKHPGGYRARG